MKWLDQIKKHPIIIFIGIIVALYATYETGAKIKNKVCISASPYYEPAVIEENIQALWVDVTSKEITDQFGKAVFTRSLEMQSLWFYKATNAYIAVGFANDGSNRVNQFIIAVQEEAMDQFSGFKLPLGEEGEGYFGSFNLSKNSISDLSNVSISTISIPMGGVNGGSYGVYFEFDPLPKIFGFYYPNIMLNAISIPTFRSSNFGKIVLTGTLSDAADPFFSLDAKEAEIKQARSAKEAAIQEINKSKPGWLHVSDHGAVQLYESWIAELFKELTTEETEYAGLLSQLCSYLK